MKKILAFLTLTIILSSSTHAAADTEAKVIKVATYHDKYAWSVIFDRPISCGGTSTASSTAFLFETATISFGNAFTIATAAVLSGHPVEVSGGGLGPNGFCKGVWLALK